MLGRIAVEISSRHNVLSLLILLSRPSTTSNFYLVFVSYDLISSSLVNGVCSTKESPPQTLSPPFSVTGSQLGYYEASSVIQHVQLTKCGFSGVQATASPSLSVLSSASFSHPTSSSVLSSSGDASSSSALRQATSGFETLSTLSATSSLSTSASSSSDIRQATSGFQTKDKIIIGLLVMAAHHLSLWWRSAA